MSSIHDTPTTTPHPCERPVDMPDHVAPFCPGCGAVCVWESEQHGSRTEAPTMAMWFCEHCGVEMPPSPDDWGLDEEVEIVPLHPAVAALVAAARALWADRDAVQEDQPACRRLYNAWRDLGAALRPFHDTEVSQPCPRTDADA